MGSKMAQRHPDPLDGQIRLTLIQDGAAERTEVYDECRE
jgi:hypothetical protein